MIISDRKIVLYSSAVFLFFSVTLKLTTPVEEVALALLVLSLGPFFFAQIRTCRCGTILNGYRFTLFKYIDWVLVLITLVASLALITDIGFNMWIADSIQATGTNTKSDMSSVLIITGVTLLSTYFVIVAKYLIIPVTILFKDNSFIGRLIYPRVQSMMRNSRVDSPEKALNFLRSIGFKENKLVAIEQKIRGHESNFPS